MNSEALNSFQKLLEIMDDLREKCPWDQKQTLDSLRYLSIEELYELSDAILEKDMDGIKGELGDLLLHIVFYSKIGSETGDFDIKTVIDGICEKLIRRHPHIYGDVKVENEEDVKRNWEAIKLKEKGKERKGVLDGVPKSLPAMVKACRIQEKVKAVGFDWPDRKGVIEKVKEEFLELEEEITNNSSADKIEDELGDVLFSIINYSRYIGVNPEDALERVNKKFIRRFQFIEQKAFENNEDITQIGLEKMDQYWNEAKKLENKIVV